MIYKLFHIKNWSYFKFEKECQKFNDSKEEYGKYSDVINNEFEVIANNYKSTLFFPSGNFKVLFFVPITSVQQS